jgi:hypothetical protein
MASLHSNEYIHNTHGYICGPARVEQILANQVDNLFEMFCRISIIYILEHLITISTLFL